MALGGRVFSRLLQQFITENHKVLVIMQTHVIFSRLETYRLAYINISASGFNIYSMVILGPRTFLMRTQM